MRRLFRDTRGATIVEFAIILPVMCGLIMGGLELGYRTYMGAIIQGALLDAARLASVGNKTGTEIDTFIKDRVHALGNRSQVKTIEKQSFYNFSNVGRPEKITSDTDPIGTYNATDCYEDANNNGVYDTNLTTGLGTADDIVRYTVTVEYPNILPVNKLLGFGARTTIIATTVLRNQPFTSRAQPVIRCP